MLSGFTQACILKPAAQQFPTWPYMEWLSSAVCLLLYIQLKFLANFLLLLPGMCRPAQPVLLSYRSSTLYGAAEQAVGGAAAVASLSIASIMGPQVRFGMIVCRASGI